MKDLESFLEIWCNKNILCAVKYNEFFSPETRIKCFFGAFVWLFLFIFYLPIHLFFYVCENVHNFQIFCVVVKIKIFFFVLLCLLCIHKCVCVYSTILINQKYLVFLCNNNDNDNTSNKSVVVKIKKNLHGFAGVVCCERRHKAWIGGGKKMDVNPFSGLHNFAHLRVCGVKEIVVASAVWEPN